MITECRTCPGDQFRPRYTRLPRFRKRYRTVSHFTDAGYVSPHIRLYAPCCSRCLPCDGVRDRYLQVRVRRRAGLRGEDSLT